MNQQIPPQMGMLQGQMGIPQLTPIQLMLLQYIMNARQPAPPVIEKKPRKHSKPTQKQDGEVKREAKREPQPKTDIPKTMPPDTRGTATEKRPQIASASGGPTNTAEAKTMGSGLMGMQLAELRKSTITRKPKHKRLTRRRDTTRVTHGITTEGGRRIVTETGRVITRE